MPVDGENTQLSSDAADQPQDPLGILGWEIGGKYIISAYIGGGGFGEVYQGYNKNLPDQRLVFKFFKRVQIRDKFDKEARILCMLDHPNISRVIDYLPEEGAVVVAFIDGRDGSHLLKESGALPEDLMLNVARALSSAVAYAHKKNIAHRDLKPGNVMFDKNGHIYLIDFGIAKEIGSQATKTAYQALTPMFAAPERQDGEADYNPFLSDIYETGVTLFNFATNDLPYRNPANPNYNDWGGASADKLSPEFRRILKKATHPLPEMRYKDASELAQELTQLKRAFGSDETETGRKKKGKGWVVALVLIIFAVSLSYLFRDNIANIFQQLTARQSVEAPEKTEPKSLANVIDSIVSDSSRAVITPAVSDTQLSVVPDTTPAQAILPVKDTARPVIEQKVAEKKETVLPAETKSEPAKTTPEVKKEEVAVKPEPAVEEETRHALTIKTSPSKIYKLVVGRFEAGQDSTFLLDPGNHNIAIYHPDYPILRNTVYLSKTTRSVAYNLADEFKSLASAHLQVALIPMSDEHVVELAFNGKKFTLLEFPAFDLTRPKGKWLVEAMIFSLGSGKGEPRIDSLVCVSENESSRSRIAGNHGEMSLGSTGWQDETVKFFIYWSEKK